ncbi:hypothetical protein BGU81_02270 [Clostridioides difficile]|nr:hypothetical protein BGU81_02270 [Clostridioides difficile]
MYMKYKRNSNVVIQNIIVMGIYIIIFTFIIVSFFTLCLYLLLQLSNHLKFMDIVIYFIDFASILFTIIINIFIIHSFFKNEGGGKK